MRFCVREHVQAGEEETKNVDRDGEAKKLHVQIGISLPISRSGYWETGPTMRYGLYHTRKRTHGATRFLSAVLTPFSSTGTTYIASPASVSPVLSAFSVSSFQLHEALGESWT